MKASAQSRVGMDIPIELRTDRIWPRPRFLQSSMCNFTKVRMIRFSSPNSGGRMESADTHTQHKMPDYGQ